MRDRLNIGLLVDDIDAVFTSQAVKGAELGAIAIDANMFVIPGMYLDNVDISEDHLRYEYQYNTLFQYVSKNNLDVVYIMLGMIGCRVSASEKARFLEQYLGVPVVTLYTKMDGYQSIIFDNKSSFLKGIRHLINDHKARNIGYVSGPKTNVDAMERLEAYKEALAEADIPYNEDYVVYGNFEESSEGLISDLVKKHPALEAVVFANDRMALGGYRAFEKLGLRVGRDLLVVSFDNSDFATSLTPGLTTVEANAAELSYKAIIEAPSFIRTGKMEDMRVNTHLVMRSSCGCMNYDYKVMSLRTGIQGIMDMENKHDAVEKVWSYLFNSYIEGSDLWQIKDDVSIFIKMLCEMVSENKFLELTRDVRLVFSQLVSQPLYKYTTVELLANLLKSLQHELKAYIKETDKKIEFVEMFSDFYRELAIINWRSLNGQQVGMDRISRKINGMTIDMFRMDAGERIPYERALENLKSIGIDSAYLYTFEQTIYHSREGRFKCPDKLLFRAYCNEDKTFSIPEEEQLVDTRSIYANDKLPKDRRVTMVISPMFSCEELYGILMTEVYYGNFRNVGPVAMQISIALKSLLLLEQQEKVQERLEESMLQMSQNNDFLKQISKTDQLTGLYNRWGFLEHVKTILDNPRNYGKRAQVLYADMDNLKMINDDYGHDDGDYALQRIAAILKEAFRDVDVVGRFGGDEFVAFMMSEDIGNENIIKHRIGDIIDRYNKLESKPYLVDMSTGICEVVCEPNMNIYEALAEADKKLYQEKRRKKSKLTK